MTTIADVEVEDEYRPCECACYCAQPRDDRRWACPDCRAGMHMDREGKQVGPDISSLEEVKT